ncbi:MAG: T9SS type A sorting domain-containing protein [Chitinophagales bacterium]
MKKNLLLIVIIIGISLQITAQALYPVSLDEKTSFAELIIEGKVTEQKSFWDPGHTMIYTSNTVEVYKIFKGNVNTSTVEIMTIGGSVGNKSISASDLLELSPEEMGVFFCYPNKINLRSPFSNKVLFDVWSSSQGFLKYNPVTLTANAPFVRIGNIDNDLYNSLMEKTGRSFEEIKPFRVSDLKKEARIQLVSITSFSPTTVHAGATIDAANNVLTITGTGFGTPSGVAAVLFDDANDGTGGSLTVVAFDSPLMVSWSSTSIVVKVPTRAGTGNIIVRDDAGLVGASSSELTVRYSILTAPFVDGPATVIKESNLMNTDGVGGYTVQYSTSTAGGGVDLNADPAKATFQRALTTWKELTGVRFVEGGTTSIQVVPAAVDDGINTIMFDNTNTTRPPLAAGVLATCFSFNSMCTPITTNEVQKTGFDVVIRNPGVSLGSTSFTIGPCPPASSSFTEIDLETVLLHELGHALNLGHINDGLQGIGLPEINPGKLMNFNIVNGVRRNSLDNSAYIGALYAVTPQGNTYGSCGLFPGEMTLLSTTTESKDECPTFPSSALANGTVVSFDLVHATSNKDTDPQYLALNCLSTGTGVTNSAFYALKTTPGGSGTLLLTVSGYTTVPAALASCTPTGGYPAAAGIELALYAVSSCPAGQSFPAPIACRTFNADGLLTAISGLSTDATYLLVVDGIENTKATFDLTFGGSALPIHLLSFTGEKRDRTTLLKWETASEFNNDRFEIETSNDGINFYKIGSLSSHGNSTTAQSYSFTDNIPAKGINYYRLKQIDEDGKHTYSKTVSVIFEETGSPVVISPNPVRDRLTIDILKPSENVIINVFSSDGKMVKKQSLGTVQRNSTINVSDLSVGTYLLRITTSSEVYQVKFIKQ